MISTHLSDGVHLDESYPQKVKSFIEQHCKQAIGEWYGQTIELIPWQYDEFIKPVWGLRQADKSRLITQAALWLPKSQGKSTLQGAIGLHEVLCGPPGAYAVIVANTIEQAGIVYNAAKSMAEFMLESNPKLEGKLWPRANLKTIEYKPSKSILKVMSGEGGKAKAGFPISLLIIDEIADFNDALLYDHLTYNARKRKGSLTVSISTAGFSTSSIGRERYEYSKAILTGQKTDKHFYPLIYEADPKADWTSLDTAKACNPSWNKTVFPELVQQELTEATNNPRLETAYKTLRLNLWQGSSTAWLSSKLWEECGVDAFPDFTGHTCVIGTDLSRRRDLTAYVCMFKKDDLYYFLPRFFVPEDLAQAKSEEDHVDYRSWARQGYLTLTPGNVVDYRYIRESIKADAKKYKILEIAYDERFAEQLCNEQLRAEDHFDCMPVKPYVQHVSRAASEFERCLLAKQIRHPNNPVLTWNAGNVVIKPLPDGAIFPNKAQDHARADGIFACLFALARAERLNRTQGDWFITV